MKFKDHLDFHKLPFDKEKIREQVEKIAADCMRWVMRRQNARPLLAMALCTCIAFSAMVPYIPVAAPAEISTERITEPETFDILEDPTERETEETTAEIDPDAPAPYKSRKYVRRGIGDKLCGDPDEGADPEGFQMVCCNLRYGKYGTGKAGACLWTQGILRSRTVQSDIKDPE